MSTENRYKIAAILLGYGLIIFGFTILGESLEDKIKILNIIVSCVIFTLYAGYLLFPLVEIQDKAHKEVGMIGLHFSAIITYSILSISLMVGGILFDLSPTIQIFGQVLFVMILFLGRTATLHAGAKVQHINNQEEYILSGKENMQESMNDFMDETIGIIKLDNSTETELQSIQESLRFISPSRNENARKLEMQFIQTLENLKVLMRDTYLNKDRISEEIKLLKNTLARRKNINS